MSHHPPTSRPKPTKAGNEEAGAVLNLGEFEKEEPLTLSEAALVINTLTARRRAEHRDQNDTDILNKTIEYLDAFSRFKKKENVQAVERLLETHEELHKFEQKQLGSLCCETAEEAKTLIPSIQNKISDDDLQELLEQMYKLMGR